MSKRTQEVMKEEKNLTVSSSGGQQYFDMIPIDLIIKIFSRLMCGKSMGRCRCVSKLWSSILRGPNQNQLFQINSPEPPRFLFTFVFREKIFYYTSPQPQHPDENSSLVATLHHTTPNWNYTRVFKMCPPVRGWVCRERTGQKFKMVTVFNPITGQSFTSPKLKGRNTTSYFGYDPVHNQFKVLFITDSMVAKQPAVQHQVLTLESTGNLVWRNIPCCYDYSLVPYRIYPRNEYFGGNGICINGVIYYKGFMDSEEEEDLIVCFNVGSERFDFVAGEKRSTLINYKGSKLGVIVRGEQGVVLRVLEDVEEQQWSKHVYEMKDSLLDASQMYTSCAGTTGGGGIVSHPYRGDGFFYIRYYNPEKKSLVRIRLEVPGFEFKFSEFFTSYTFPNYVEEVKLIM